MGAILNALRASGVGQNVLSGQINTSYQTQNTPTAPKPSFLSSVGSGIGSVASMAGSGAIHALTDLGQHALNFVQGEGRDLGFNNQKALDAHTKQLDAANQAALNSYKATGNKAAYLASLKQLQAGYSGISAAAKAIPYTTAEATKDYVPLATTALSVAAPFIKPIAIAADAAEGGGALAAGAKAAGAASRGLNSATAAGSANISGLGGAARLAGTITKNVVLNNAATQPATTAVGDLSRGNIKGAAGNIALLTTPLGIAGIAKAAPIMGERLATAMYGKQGFFDAVAKAGGPDMLAHLDSLAPTARKQLTGLLRQVQQYNLDQFKGNAKNAGQYFVQSLIADGRDLSNMDAKTLAGELKTWVTANKTANRAYNDGMMLHDPISGNPVELKPGQRIIAARFDNKVYGPLKEQFAAAGTPEGRQAIIDAQRRLGANWTKNPNLLSRVTTAVKGDDWEKQFGNITRTRSTFIAPTKNMTAAERAVFKGGDKYQMPAGYHAAIADNARADFRDVKDTAELDRGVAPGKVLGKVGNTLTRAGLSTEAPIQGQQNALLKAAFARHLAAQGVEGDSNKILSALRGVDKRGAADPRFLTKTDIESALVGTATKADAGKVLKAIRNAYADLPASVVGAGGKAVNKTIQKVPAMATYLRLEQAGRYDSGLLSIGFRIKQFVKGNLVAAAEGRKIGVNPTGDEVAALKEHGLMSMSHAGGDQGIIAGNSGQGTKLLPPEQRTIIGGLAASIARAHGTTVDQILAAKGPLADKLKESVDLVHGYGSGSYLNSPMAKTLNVLIFPSRFDTKIAIEASKAVSKMPAVHQAALAAGIANTVGFLGSPKGKQWQKDNATAIGLIQAFSPLQTIQNVYNFTNRGGHIGDLGQVGGLPIGVLSTILQHQGLGLGKLGPSQGINPATDTPYAMAVPTTEKARVQTALTDLIGSMYSYPGRTAGLSAKTAVTQTVIPGLKPAVGSTQYRLNDGTVAPSLPKPGAKPAQRLNTTPQPTGRLVAPKIAPAKITARKTRAKVYGFHNRPI